MNIVFCRNCGTQIEESANNCTKCGAQQATTPQGGSNNPLEQGLNWFNRLGTQDLSTEWKMKFSLIEKAGGVSLTKLKELPFGDRLTVRFNFFSFFLPRLLLRLSWNVEKGTNLVWNLYCDTSYLHGNLCARNSLLSSPARMVVWKACQY